MSSLQLVMLPSWDGALQALPAQDWRRVVAMVGSVGAAVEAVEAVGARSCCSSGPLAGLWLQAFRKTGNRTAQL